jgi:hypothetical protein
LWERNYDELDLQRTLAKQSQFPCGRRWPRAAMAAGTAAGTKRAKQSQFALDRPEEALAARTPRAVAAGQKRAKQSQFPPVGPTRGTWNRQLRAKRGNPPPYGAVSSCNVRRQRSGAVVIGRVRLRSQGTPPWRNGGRSDLNI